MKIVGVIPARYDSTRLKAKVLLPIQGKPMIQHVYERALKSKRLNSVLIACDDVRIIDAAERFNAKCVLTSRDHQSGSDRIAEAIKDVDADIIVNIQGDEPLITPQIIDSLVDSLTEDPQADMSTVIKKFEKDQDVADPNIVKVVIDDKKNALYFSRSVIPFNRNKTVSDQTVYYKHLGIYAYRKNFLLSFVKMPPSSLEKMEQLEQLRALEAGTRIKTIETQVETIGVDTDADLTRVEEFLKKEAVHG